MVQHLQVTTLIRSTINRHDEALLLQTSWPAEVLPRSDGSRLPLYISIIATYVSLCLLCIIIATYGIWHMAYVYYVYCNIWQASQNKMLQWPLAREVPCLCWQNITHRSFELACETTTTLPTYTCTTLCIHFGKYFGAPNLANNCPFAKFTNNISAIQYSRGSLPHGNKQKMKDYVS